VEAVPAHSFLRVPPRQGEGLGDRGLGAMESGVEAGDLRQVRGLFGHRLDCLQIVRLVQRCERNERLQPFQDLRGDKAPGT